MSIEGINGALSYIRENDSNFNNVIEKNVASERGAYEAAAASDIDQDGRITLEEYLVASSGDALAISNYLVTTLTSRMFNHDLAIDERLEAAQRLADMGCIDPLIDALYNQSGEDIMLNVSVTWVGGAQMSFTFSYLKGIADILIKAKGEGALEIFRYTLSSLDENVQKAAIYGINQFNSSTAIDYLIEALGLPNLSASAMYDLIKSLEASSDVRAIEPLISLIDNLEDPDNFYDNPRERYLGDVQEYAIQALAKLGKYTDDDSRIINCLLVVKSASPNIGLRTEALKALGELGGEIATNSLIYTLENDADILMRETAAEALGWIGGQKAFDALAKIAGQYGQNEQLSYEAALLPAVLKALGQFPAATPILNYFANIEGNAYLRSVARYELGLDN